MPKTSGQPLNPDLWHLVRRCTLDALVKINAFRDDVRRGAVPPENQALVTQYGYKALFADPWAVTRGVLYSPLELDGLDELSAGIESIPVIMTKFPREDSPENGPSATARMRYQVSMIPLVLADRYTSRDNKTINERELVRLYLSQESYLLGTELFADIIIPVIGAQIRKGYRFKEFSLMQSTPELRAIFGAAQDISPMDRRTLSSFRAAMVIRNTPVDVEGYGFYFGAGPMDDGYDLIERFFDALNVAAPLSGWFAQLAVRPRGWVGSFERPHGEIFSFLFRNHMSRIVNRHNFDNELTDAEVQAGYRYCMSLKVAHPSIRVAAHRFMLAFDRGDDDDDTVVDLCIGLEAILGAGFGETVHRISLRAAAMLTQAGWQDSQSAYKAIRDIYAYRSKVVHGVRGPYKEEELRFGNTMVHAVRYATAALSALIQLALNTEQFNPDKVDSEFIFPALNAARRK